jgi:hypothetical protein
MRPEVYYRIRKGLSPVPILSKVNPVHIISPLQDPS